MQHRAVLYWQWYAKFLHSFFFKTCEEIWRIFLSLVDDYHGAWSMRGALIRLQLKTSRLFWKYYERSYQRISLLKKNPETNKFESAFAALYRVTTGLDVVSDIDNLQTLSKKKYFRVIHADFAKVKTRNIYVLFSYFLPSKRSLAFLFPFFLFA